MLKELLLGKVLSNLAKTLSIANQLIPLYQDAKPLVKKANNIYTIFNKKENKKEKNPVKDFKKSIINNQSPIEKNNNNPQFFI